MTTAAKTLREAKRWKRIAEAIAKGAEALDEMRLLDARDDSYDETKLRRGDDRRQVAADLNCWSAACERRSKALLEKATEQALRKDVRAAIAQMEAR